MVRWVHIAAGLVAIVAGFTALFAKTGSPLHLRAGDVFVFAMVTLTGTALYAASFIHPNRGNVVAALVTLYLVTSGFLTVKRDVAAARGWYVALMILGALATARAAWLGMVAVREGGVDHFPAGVFFAFGFVSLSGTLLDWRLLVVRRIEGAQRLVRHLWRMCTGMWIATASLFLGQAKFFPDAMRGSGVLNVPVLVVAGVGLFELVRVLRRKRKARLSAHQAESSKLGLQLRD
ncbi:hypothetical protein LVB87_15315 [Lysobacter sp. KIS68-7]|uniref:hypothetical protein n=1 Tax=Lysobacter sp. KIS68-7 TaxID=2904252 RepID=UPI001E2B4AC7|nr:hypothetical protein [Lysobacter sp. KIS68-7]UHQ19536.1 hypothetical protein LVB87_15315 [Lysobacter sp. KIS68-7]